MIETQIWQAIIKLNIVTLWHVHKNGNTTFATAKEVKNLGNCFQTLCPPWSFALRWPFFRQWRLFFKNSSFGKPTTFGALKTMIGTPWLWCPTWISHQLRLPWTSSCKCSLLRVNRHGPLLKRIKMTRQPSWKPSCFCDKARCWSGLIFGESVICSKDDNDTLKYIFKKYIYIYYIIYILYIYV